MMKNKRFWLQFAFCTLFLVVPSRGFSQSAPHSEWAILDHLSTEDKLDVELKSGSKVSGRFSRNSDVALTLFNGSATQDIRRDDIRRVYRVRRKHVVKSTLVGTAIGAAAGASLGAAAGEDCSSSRFGVCFSRSTTVPVGAVVVAIPGAVAGLVWGLVHHNRELIYGF